MSVLDRCDNMRLHIYRSHGFPENVYRLLTTCFYSILIFDVTFLLKTLAFVRKFSTMPRSASGSPCNTVGSLADVGCPCHLIGQRCRRPFSLCMLPNGAVGSPGDTASARGICQCDRQHYFDRATGLCLQSNRQTSNAANPVTTTATVGITCPAAPTTPATYPTTVGVKTALDNYYDACAQIPRGIRDIVGCPLELPDLSDSVIGYTDTTQLVNGDLMQSTQLFEGDIRVASITYQIIAATDSQGRKKRQVTSEASAVIQVCSRLSLWSGGIPYVIGDGFTQENINYITQKMCDIAAKTCVQFFPRTTETDYIKIVNKVGCWSFVGRQGGVQLLSLQITDANNRTCLTGTNVEHELMHALGFVHEHARLDRDTYIDIHFDNINETFQNNFLKYNRKFVPDVPFDTKSIMHYNSEAFALNITVPVITLRNNGSRINAATTVSELDYEKINSLYSCSKSKIVSEDGVPTAYTASDICVEPAGNGTGAQTPDPTGPDTCVLFGSGGGGGRG